jgi:uncharacterized protein YabN with tetrapyrrole methylase and pyrophosphatase domain
MRRSFRAAPRRLRAMADKTKSRYTLDDLLAVMARLRDKDTGCPWDVQQSFTTIAPYTIEEAYEVADAIAREDLDALKGELGDLLLQACITRRWRPRTDSLPSPMSPMRLRAR